MPHAEVLVAAAEASLQNARRLWIDANLLLDRSSVPSAYALGVLSLEESGKAILCIAHADLDDSDARSTRARFTEDFKDHKAKLLRIVRALDMLQRFPSLLMSVLQGDPVPSQHEEEQYRADLRKLARDENDRKFAAFYVDILDDNTVHVPALSIAHDEAERVVFLGGVALQIATHVVAGEDTEAASTS